MHLVTGATGHVGGALARRLLEAGERVRVLVRDPARATDLAARGAEVMGGDLQDPGALARALTGMTAAFLLLPPWLPGDDLFAAQQVVARVLAEAVRATRVPRVVFLSSLGAQYAAGTGPIKGLHVAETLLRESGARLTCLRAGYFMENVGGSVGAAKGQGIFPWFGPDRPFEAVATPDVAEAAFAALHAPPAAVRITHALGPAPIRPSEIAAAFAAALGKPVSLAPLPIEAAPATLRQLGVPGPLADAYGEMYKAFSEGLVTVEGTDVRRGKIPIGEVVKRMV